MDFSLLSSLKSFEAATSKPDIPDGKADAVLGDADNIAAIKESAKDFETAFITQMLTFSGLGDALTLGGGQEASAFTSFYMENIAEQITEAGGFGLADKFYEKLLLKSGLSEEENKNVDFGTL